MELNKIIIGVVLTAVISATFLLFISEGVSNYAPTTVPANYGDSFREINTSLGKITNYTEATRDELNDIDGNSNAVTDFLGFFFGNGYQAVKTFIKGMELTTIIAEEGVENTMGDTGLGKMWLGAISAIIIILLVSILLHFIIKSERL